MVTDNFTDTRIFLGRGGGENECHDPGYFSALRLTNLTRFSCSPDLIPRNRGFLFMVNNEPLFRGGVRGDHAHIASSILLDHSRGEWEQTLPPKRPPRTRTLTGAESSRPLVPVCTEGAPSRCRRQVDSESRGGPPPRESGDTEGPGGLGGGRSASALSPLQVGERWATGASWGTSWRR